jgi:hypothetical protein
MGQFYASLEQGHTTASVALKRLAGFTTALDEQPDRKCT